MDRSLIVASSPVLTQALDDAEQHIQPDWTPEQAHAARIHYSFVNVARFVGHASRALRDLAAEMYLSGAYASLVLQIDGTDIKFADFREWLSYATETAGLSDSTASAINNYVNFIVDPVSKGLIHRPSGETVQLEDVAELRERHTQVLGMAARKLLSDPEKGTAAIGELIEMAEDPTISGEELAEEARKRGLRGRRIPQAEAQVINLGHRTIFLVVASTEPQELSIQSALDARVEWRTVTLEDAVEYLRMQKIMEVDMPVDPIEGIEEQALDDIELEEYLRQVS